MFGSDALGIAVGLIVLYLLMSVLASAIQELLESLMKYRARYLESALREMFADRAGTGPVAAFYAHPLVNGLFRGVYDARRRGNLPSYIPGRTFALALVDLMRKAPRVDPVGAVIAPPTPVRLGLLDVPLSSRPSIVEAAIDVAAQAQTTGAAVSQPTAAAPDAAIASLRAAIAGTTDLGESAQQALLVLVDSAGPDVDLAMKKIEDWYDTTMDRVSGWYKRHTQWMLLLTGIAIATLFNVDSVALFRSLADDPAQRAVLMSVAQSSMSTAVLPDPDVFTTSSDAPTRVARSGCSSLDSPDCAIAGHLNALRALGLPLGWDARDVRLVPTTAVGWAWKVIGICVTALAMTLGAPFWFDILNKVMSARVALKPPSDQTAPSARRRAP